MRTRAVSLIILNFNKSHLTAGCLRNVWRYTGGYPYEILVVDNGSDPDDFAALTAISGPIRLVRLQTNRFFGEGNNIGAELARADFVCFMNNDIIVTPHWLEPLMEVHERHADCGAVGPKFVYPDGSLQEAGALIDAAGDAGSKNILLSRLDDRALRERHDERYVSAAQARSSQGSQSPKIRRALGRSASPGRLPGASRAEVREQMHGDSSRIAAATRGICAR